MSRVKHTKNELKAQREALRRFERFLPMLQLKKQQLQAEIQAIVARIQETEQETTRIRTTVAPWQRLWAEPMALETRVSVDAVLVDEGNIAGVSIPVFRDIRFGRATCDLFRTPPWIDDALESLEQLLRLRAIRLVLEEQRRRIEAELRTTAQRVNLFEKVKIPECRENIRMIRIFLGDEQTAAVARGKIAKRRSEVAVAA